MIDTALAAGTQSTLREDARGLLTTPKWLPPKHLYDAEGSRLFDAICDTPEYYQTRTEAALLESYSKAIVERASPTHLVELGSGTARKTRLLLDALGRQAAPQCMYVPLEVDQHTLEESAGELLDEYPWLHIHGVVGDFGRTLERIPRGDRRLIAFLGGTIGNFAPDDAVEFLSAVRESMHEGDHFLLGTDLVKDVEILNAAYNDAQGITAQFNKNLLNVLNREFEADFDPDAFEHIAFFDPKKEWVEMRLRSRVEQTVVLPVLDATIEFAAGEPLHTEISRKFTEDSTRRMLEASGFELVEWYTPPDEWFALSLSAPVVD